MLGKMIKNKKIIKNKKNELKDLENKIEGRRKMDRLLKTSSCDWCLEELWSCNIDKVYEPIAQITFGYKRVLLCHKHLEELNHWTADTIKKSKKEMTEKVPKMKAALI